MSRPDRGPDGTRPAPSLHTLLELLPDLVNEDPLTVATELRDRYGHVVRIPPIHPALDEAVYLVSHPDDVQFVLQSDPSRFRALDVPGSRDFGRVVRNSVVSLTPSSDEGSWIQRTRLLSPEFSEAAIQSHVPELAETTLATMAELSAGPGRVTDGDPTSVPDGARAWTPDADGVRLLPAMRRLTLRLLGISLFGEDMRAHEADVIDAVDTLRSLFKHRQLHMVTSYLTRYLPDELHLPRWLRGPLGADPHVELTSRHERQVREAVRTLEAAADAVVSRRERTPMVFDDALGEWLRRPDEVSGEYLSADALRQEVLGLLIAGHATTSAGLTWAFYLLADRPAVQDLVHAEARETDLLTRGGGRDDPALTTRDVEGGAFLDALPYTRQVWREAIRLYPPLPIFGRTTKQAVDLQDTTVPADSHVLLSPYVSHRDPDVWDHPDLFDPSRFAPNRAGDRHEFAYFPFSAGRHACLGEAIATTEALVVLAATLATHRVEFTGPDAAGPHDGPDVGIDSAINLQPDREVTVRFVPRS